MNEFNKNRSGYKKTEIGWIPDDWGLETFKDLFYRVREPVKVEPKTVYQEIGIRSHGKGIFHKTPIYGFELGKKSVFWVKNNALIFNIVFAWEQAVAITSKTESGLIASHRFPMYKGKNSHIDIKFVRLFFLSKRGKHLLGIASPGGAGRNKTLGKGELKHLLIPIPSIIEQKKISQILYTWDKAINHTHKIIAAKKKHKKALMQQLFSGKKRLFGLGNTKNVDDPYPNDWPVVKMRDLFKPIKRKNINNCKKILSASGRHGLIDQGSYFNRSVAGAFLQNYYLIKKGEFAYNRSAMREFPYGAIKRLDKYDEGILSTLYICFSLNDGESDIDFYKYFFDSNILDKELSSVIQIGARNHGLLNISLNDFYNIPIPKPPQKEQVAIAGIIAASEKEIIKSEEKLKVLRKQKRGLMQKLLTGEVRVTP